MFFPPAPRQYVVKGLIFLYTMVSLKMIFRKKKIRKKNFVNNLMPHIKLDFKRTDFLLVWIQISLIHF